MTERLREELRRLGDAAPELEIPHETWARGRRARSRDRLVAGAAALAIVALAGTLLRITPADRLAMELLSTDEPEISLGVPDRIHAIPSRLLDGWDAEAAPGVAAAAYSTERGDAFVVSAADGTYHRVRLARLDDPDRTWVKTTLSDLSDGGTWLAVSPDGRFLAYSWDQPTALGGTTRTDTGVSVMDLVSGRENLVVEVTGGAGVVVDDLSWSPDGRWISWSGVQTTSWTDYRRSYGPAAYGRIDVVNGDHASATVMQSDLRGTAIGNDGVVRLVGAPGGAILPDWAVARPVSKASADIGGRGFSASPDGRSILAGARLPTQELVVLSAEGSAPRTIRLPRGDYPEGALLRPVGWVDVTHAVVEVIRVTGDSDSGWSWSERELVVVDVNAADTPPLVVGEVDARYDGEESIVGLTVATDLMSLDQPTVPRPEPSWPWSTGQKLATTGLVALGLALAAYLLLRLLRLRRARRLLP